MLLADIAIIKIYDLCLTRNLAKALWSKVRQTEGISLLVQTAKRGSPKKGQKKHEKVVK